MAWIVKCLGKQKSRKYARAILSKYGQKINPSIFAFQKKTLLNGALQEIAWCRERGINVQIDVIEVGDFDYVFI